MQYRVLGPLVVGAVALKARQHRVLLSRLLMSVNQSVSRDQLAEALWGGHPPTSSDKLVQVYVSQVRKLIGHEAIGTGPLGYSLAAGPDDVDATVFEALLHEGVARQADNPLVAASVLRRALALWRGAAHADVVDESFAAAEVTRLEELRLQCLEERIAADLAVGRHDEVLGEVLALVRAHPLRERLRHHLMLALYRCGRQADALEAYTATRAVLVEELGLEPGRELRELERAILRQDVSLGGPRPAQPDWHVPHPATRLIGRRRELDRLAELVSAPHVRLVTLAGPGGCGKSRVALQLAREQGGSYANGAVFVELGALVDPSLLMPTLASALGVPETPGEPLERSIQKWIAPRELLLVLDTFEHIVDAGAALATLLTWSPGITVLVTSRRVLHLSGEHVFPLDPLPEDDALSLFLERAQAVSTVVALSASDEPVVREICRRLDGLPLAVELAAARSRNLSAHDLLAALTPRLGRLLTGGPRDVPERQRTLREALAWSTDLLTEEQRRHFARLGVFAGGCTAEAASAVCRTDPDTIAALHEASLVQRLERGDVIRIALLDTIREHAQDLMAAERADVAARHAAYYSEMARVQGGAIGGQGEASALATLTVEHNNLRAAFDFLAIKDAAACLRLAADLWRFWWGGGHLVEGRSRLELALGLDPRPSPARAAAARGAAILATRQGHAVSALAWARESKRAAEAVGDPLLQAQALLCLGNALLGGTDLKECLDHYERAAELASAIGAVREQGVALLNLGNLALYGDDLGRAQSCAEKSISLFLTIGDMPGVATNKANLGHVALRTGSLADAHDLFEESRRIYGELQFDERVAMAVDGLAAVAAAQGELASAARLLGQSEAMLRGVGATLEPLELEVHDNTLAVVREGLGEKACARLMGEGAQRAGGWGDPH